MSNIEPIYRDENVRLLDVELEGESLQAVELRVADRDSWALCLRAKHGMLGCRLFDVNTADKLSLAFAVIGAPDTEALLKAKPVALSKQALALGAAMDMSGEELAVLFSKEPV